MCVELAALGGQRFEGAFKLVLVLLSLSQVLLFFLEGFSLVIEAVEDLSDRRILVVIEGVIFLLHLADFCGGNFFEFHEEILLALVEVSLAEIHVGMNSVLFS